MGALYRTTSGSGCGSRYGLPRFWSSQPPPRYRMLTQRTEEVSRLARELKVGDLVFTRVPAPLFMQVADVTASWTNHVGVVIDDNGTIAESRVPLSATTGLRSFVRRSAGGRIAVARLRRPLSHIERKRVMSAARRRTGILYDTGFNIRSRRQFCSRFAREVINEATGVQLGAVERFSELLRAQPDASLWFWKLWYFGRIPWDRETVTPASVLRSPALEIVFVGHAQ